MVRTLARPPRMRRLSRSALLSRLNGATPTTGDLLVGQGVGIRQVGQQGIGDLVTDAGGREQQVTPVAPLLDLLDPVGAVLVEFFDLCLDVTDMAADLCEQLGRHDVQAVLFHAAHFDELPPPGGQLPDFAYVSGRRWSDLRLHRGGIAAQECGIDLVSFGQYTLGPGIASDLDGLADDDRVAAFSGGEHEVVFATARGLDDDAGQFVSGGAPEHCADTLGVIGYCEMQRSLVDGDIQLMFASIDADVDGFFPVLRHCSVTSPLLNSGSWAHSTVRDRH